jgi:hypothetical protein
MPRGNIIQELNAEEDEAADSFRRENVFENNIS